MELFTESYRGKFRDPNGRFIEVTVKNVTANIDHTDLVCDEHAKHVITRIDGEIAGVADNVTLEELNHTDYVEGAIGDTITDAVAHAINRQ